MSMEDSSTSQPKPVDKGKRRAVEPTEQTPLLDHASQSSSIDEPLLVPSRRPLWNKLLSVFLVSLSISIVALVLLVLLAYSYAAQASGVSPQDILDNALVFRGPSQVDVLNITSNHGIHLLVSGKVGLDAGSLLQVHRQPDEGGLWARIWKSLGRWGIHRLNRISLNLGDITVSPHYNTSINLARVETKPFELSLTADPPHDDSWLTDITIPVVVHPTTNASDLTSFAKDAWSSGRFFVQAEVAEATIQGGGLHESGWRHFFNRVMSNIHTRVQLPIPPLPGLPDPGRHSPFPPVSKLITLQSFSLTSASESLSLRARATAVDPVPESLHLAAPSLPFIVSLPTSNSTIPIASVETQPFSFTHPNITLDISGHVLPLSTTASPVLSAFLTRYLSAQDNLITVSSPVFPALSVDALFPAPIPRPNVLRNVTIHDMRIKAHGTSFLASGTVDARVVLPKGMKINLEIFRVFPDVLVFDGEVPDDEDITATLDIPPSPELPDPLPENAFGRIRPDDWLDSVSEPVTSDGDDGAVFAVTAKIIDVPLKVLPGRQREFSNFVGKVIFGSNGALAGIMGWASVAVNVPGLPMDNGTGSMELNRLPFQGSVRVRRNSF